MGKAAKIRQLEASLKEAEAKVVQLQGELNLASQAIRKIKMEASHFLNSFR